MNEKAFSVATGSHAMSYFLRMCKPHTHFVTASLKVIQCLIPFTLDRWCIKVHH